jgi:MFS family permease
MIQAILLAVLILTNHYVVWEILALSVILGVINAFDTPARQPMVHEMVEHREDITNALALNSAMVNIARLAGPALSGIVLQSFGAGICFSLNAFSFVAVITSLLLMKLPPFTKPVIKKKAITELVEGFQYLKKTPAIGIPVLLITCTSLLVLPYNTLIPVFAKEIFKGDAATFGYVSSFIGAGALLSSLFLASLKKGTELKNILLASVALLGVGLISFSLTHSFYAVIPFAVLTGFASLTPMTSSITIIQVEAASHMRGRVMSYVAMAYFGMLPFGSLLTGTVSQKISAPATMLCQGVVAVIIAGIFYRIIKRNKREIKESPVPHKAESVH